ncbi:response regulator [uncultured Marivita sp.]|mgnify:CR=1 FL=1|uniref:response regulator n=1 Tax=Marivita sp. TaxID=2003365 RepID=UPI0025DE92D5|nr:response regulator [uncultured Marivita sp.]MCR9111471.1 response regulator [Paracoccaceae bacterium]
MSKTVLIVDDSPSVRKMVQMTLAGAGYDIIEAEDGQDAFEKATSNRIDAILTDQNMPRLDGLNFIRQFRGTPQSVGVPIVFLSTESDANLKSQAKEAGATGWMVKPFDQNQILAVVKKIVGA